MPRARTSGAKKTGDATGSAPASRRAGATPEERNSRKLINMFNKIWTQATKKDSKDLLTIALNAAQMTGQVMGLLPDRSGRGSSTDMPGRGPAPSPKFDGNYNDAARRVAYLMRLAEKETAEQAGDPETAEGQKHDRPSPREKS